MDKSKKIQDQLKKLNEEKGPVPKELLDYYKKTNEMLNKILSSIKEEAKDIPTISKETSINTEKILWLLTAAIKYGKAEAILTKTGYPKYIAKK